MNKAGKIGIFAFVMMFVFQILWANVKWSGLDFPFMLMAWVGFFTGISMIPFAIGDYLE